MALAAHNQCMFPIAYLAVQNQMRRSLAGALATDPILPEPRRRTWRRGSGQAARLSHAPACRPQFGVSAGRDQLARPVSSLTPRG